MPSESIANPLLRRAIRRLLSVGGVEQALAHANVLGRDLNELIVDDVLEGLLQGECARRNELHGDVGSGRALVA